MRRRSLVSLMLGMSLAGLSVSAKELKVLIIANSYGVSVLDYLPKIATSQGKDLKIASLFIGGCSLERHIKELHKAEKDPNYKPYQTNYPEITNTPIKAKFKYKVNLPEMIGKEKWDIVVTQQQSSRSQDYKTFQPYADELIAYIRQHAPQAEIVFQETWSYRADDELFKGADKLTNAKMAELVFASYKEMASKGPYRVIPTGHAVQKYREKYAASGKPFLKLADVQLESGKHYYRIECDAVGCVSWSAKDKKHTFDYIHLNDFGTYLQACVWYYTLLGTPDEKIKMKPRRFSQEITDVLQACAAEAVKEYKQLK